MGFSAPEDYKMLCLKLVRSLAVVQVESLARQLQNHEKEVQRSAQQLQNAISLATEEAAKSRAAKEVIKSLTSQVYCCTN